MIKQQLIDSSSVSLSPDMLALFQLQIMTNVEVLSRGIRSLDQIVRETNNYLELILVVIAL